MKFLKSFVTFLWLIVVAVCGDTPPTQPTPPTPPTPPTEPTYQPISSNKEPSSNKENCCIEGYWYSKDADKCYKFHEDRAIWTRALKSCMQEGAMLAVLDNSQEQQAIKELFLQQGEYPRFPPDVKESAFVGIVKRKTGEAGVSGEFYNIYTNQKLNEGFAPWSPGEPNNMYGREECVTVNDRGSYSDDPCYDHLEYICERNKSCS